jgi:hypothetical protein
VPYLPPGLPPGSPEAFRTLLAYALTLGADGNPVVRVHFSDLDSVRAYDAERGAMRIPEYINELFVVVKRADDSEVVCVNIKAMGLLADCPTIEELLVFYTGGDIVIPVTNGTDDAPSVSIEDDGESYELVEDVHFTYDGSDITILDSTLSGYFSGEGDSIVIVIQFDDCDNILVQADYGVEADVDPPDL